MPGELAPEVEGQILRVADAIGGLMEAWGFKRNMGRVWALLYLEKVPMSAADYRLEIGAPSARRHADHGRGPEVTELGAPGEDRDVVVAGHQARHRE